ncbi:hypothetical protein A2Z00_05205 [Candidatus Gottesmanbacteria bacterium RBG_13_45_10]|uniref:Uncharacterized protein n=1 Tax=Candidatus Gottesmanbacteria bacterium RBG_13_45_10 TaxID=1798370 RepID=A0A1F5ZGH0_9BACT|nr:MAG: hypothetical protein A2Z00_05205 [Candidatus Gottesmanbacteria bacterium RBG_13_45_10]
MKYKALILDLDDTTVVHGLKSLPSKRVSEAIAKAKERIHVCVATARPKKEALPIFEHLELSGLCIINNGTQIYDPVKRTIIYEKVLDVAVVPAIYERCKRRGIEALVYDGVKDVPYRQGNMPKEVLSVYMPQVPKDQVEDLFKELSMLPGVQVHKLMAWDKTYLALDVTHKEVSKLHGIIEVARILKIGTEEIIGVGDGYNDFPLLLACGLKIAMGNAVPELKAIADFIAPSVDDDGVATVIEKFVLSK